MHVNKSFPIDATIVWTRKRKSGRRKRMTKRKAAQEFAGLVDQFGDYLNFLKETGTREIEVQAGALEKMTAPAPTSSAPTRPVTAPARPVAPPPPPAAASGATSGLQGIAQQVAVCQKCPLYKERTRTVPGQGHPHPDIMFVGEGPGHDEDQQGLAFVGRAGQLLTKIIEAMGFTRDQVFIGNIVKCRPPGNRQPLPDEMAACIPYLKEQISLLQPRVIVALGATAVKGLLETQTGITKLRGHWMEYEGIPLMPTYHPAYLLRNPAGKKDVWEDMKTVLEKLGRKPPTRTKTS